MYVNMDLKEYKTSIGNLSVNEKKLRDLYLRKLALGELYGPMTGYASIDKMWMPIYDSFEFDEKNINMSIFQMLEKQTRDKKKLTAMYIPNDKGDLKINYDSYIKECKRLAYAFDELGVTKGEIIPMILPNIPESRCSIYGLNYVGGISYPILPSLPPKVLEKILIDNGIDKVVLFTDFYEKYREVLNNCHVKSVIVTDGTGMIPNYLKKLVNGVAKLKGEEQPFKNYSDFKYASNIITWDEFRKFGKSSVKLEPYYKKDSIAAIIGTSGTTGIPKGVMIRNESVNCQAYQHLLAGVNYSAGDKILDILIQSISYGFSVMHYSGCFGLTSVMIPNLVTDKIAQTIYELGPDHFTGGPIHFEYIKNDELFKSGKLRPLKNAISGGAKLSRNVEETLNKTDIFVRQGYGTTECLGGATGPKGDYVMGSLGTPLPLTTMSVFVPNTDEELRYNEIGEICVTGETVMKGYLHNESETNMALKRHSDGKIWLHTGDLGYYDETGHFFFDDRISDTFMRCGFNVHPNKISEFLRNSKYVSRCYVIGVEHHSEQEVPVAFVVLKDEYIGKEDFVKEQLIAECYNNLDELAIPYDWFFVEDLPVNMSGKVVKKTLIEKYSIDYSKSDSGKEFTLLKKK